MKKSIIFSLLLLVSASPLFAGDKDGTSTAVFLRMEQGARALGMGGAFVAMDKDVESVWWNPAALSFLEGMQINAAYSDYIADISGSYVSFAKPAGKNQNAALLGSINYISVGSVDARDATGNVTKSITLSNLAASAGYSFPTAANMSFGFLFKYLQQNLGDDAGTGFAVDAGYLLRMSEKTSLGFSAQNIGQKLKIDTNENQLPMNIRAGLAHVLSPKVTIAADAEMPNDADMRIHFGSEIRMSDSFYLRGGYNTSSSVGLCAGVGVLTPIALKGKTQEGESWWKEAIDRDWNHNVVRIDYAYVSAGDLSATHRISATLKF